jgi:hypothetical protein
MLRDAPKSPAITVSRINPSTRLQSTANPTTLVAFVLTRFSASDMGQKEQQVAGISQARRLPAEFFPDRAVASTISHGGSGRRLALSY